MYGNTAAPAVLPATGLGLWSGSLALIALILLISGVIVLWRSTRSEHRP